MNLTPPPGTRFVYRKRGETIYVRATDWVRGGLGFGTGTTVEEAHAQAMQGMVDDVLVEVAS